MKNRNRGAQVSLKPGSERQDGVRNYIQKHSFDSSQDTDKHVLFNKLKNSVRTIPKKQFVMADEGTVSGLRFPICIRPNLVQICCNLVGIEEDKLLKEGAAYPYYMKKMVTLQLIRILISSLIKELIHLLYM